ncbi:hypothetical protein ACMWD3_05900, partial [Gardnerella swidsinskii]|uniref:hypothetical protein n=1 Tax=Gardnerella swidsinskii TaxID=2792979 RepID=UPI0039FC3823
IREQVIVAEYAVGVTCYTVLHVHALQMIFFFQEQRHTRVFPLLIRRRRKLFKKNIKNITILKTKMAAQNKLLNRHILCNKHHTYNTNEYPDGMG